MFEALFIASDTNGDGVLSFDEFRAMVQSLDGHKSDRAVRLFRYRRKLGIDQER
jgi:hypothetical protein